MTTLPAHALLSMGKLLRVVYPSNLTREGPQTREILNFDTATFPGFWGLYWLEGKQNHVATQHAIEFLSQRASLLSFDSSIHSFVPSLLTACFITKQSTNEAFLFVK